ncbi:conjugal transfer protein TrbL family protein [Micromonospora sp. WMMD980]|uniref:conjugal transfer protein TrbL family protein n=1 Tax=Micromonospora sp. WMMD980 TaxID=3016088 RepID=UPI002416F617|nr:conjugal transfer protein TrbL family protein [Micromonospora sp. WMMD980]MDG4803664.1 type IV secretion system protein [Micromonospora sp. WMMD980]
MSFVLGQILDWLTTAILATFDALLGVISSALLITPNVTGLPQVQALTGRSVWVVDTVFVLAFVAAGVLTMTSGGDERSRYTIKDLLPRLIVAFVAAHFSQLWCGMLIELANALTAALTTGSGDHDGALRAVKTHIAAGQDKTAALLFVICVAIIAVLLAGTAFSMIVRFAVVLVLTAAAPLALACHALPQTDPLARMWWRSYAGVLAVPVVQGFTLYAGQWMLTDPAHLLPVLGLPVEPGGVLNLFVVMVMLWTTLRVPHMMRRYVSAGNSGGGASMIGAAVRVIVVQQATRAVPGLRRGVRAVTR